MPDVERVIEVIGEGKTDIGALDGRSGLPHTGVIPVLIHRLCGEPSGMRVKRKPVPFLKNKSLAEKVKFAKREAYYNRSEGLVFVVDTEGNHPSTWKELTKGRDASMPEYPAAIGVAHPCIEAWLLSDASAIAKTLGLAMAPDLPAEPESLPAPCRDRDRNPKAVLGGYRGSGGGLSASTTTKIATAIGDLALIRERCPLSFSPFASEVEERIRPLFLEEIPG